MRRRPGRKNSPLYVKSLYGKYNRDISISHDRRAENSYIVTVKGKIAKRIYMLQNDGWYIWDEALGFRTKVKSFTEAINIIEKELSRAWHRA